MKYKYKVCVYAICKNEEKFVDRWYDSVKEADEIYVLDTGSTDNTVSKLKSHGIFVKEEIINPWRFDIARNKSLEMVPMDTDICVCLDLDEVYEKGWRKILEEYWQEDTTRLRHVYNWKIENEKPVVTFYYEKTHKRIGYSWYHPVHEILKYELGNENIVTCNKIVLNHYPDNSKSRGSYLELLELSVKEDPLDDRNMHYLGREYMYYGRWNDCIDTLNRHLKLKSATWCDERAASMRFIGRCYKNLERYEEAKLWYQLAISEAPYLRDGYVEYAILMYQEKNYLEVINLLTKTLTIKKHELTYINEIFSWDYTADNMLACSYYYLGLYDIALFYMNRAVKYDRNNKMLKDNLEIMKKANQCD